MTTALKIELTQEQKVIHDAVLDFVKEKKSQLRIGGYAGTGKTTLVAATVSALKERDKKIRIAFCCFTGKAAYVLRTKLEAAGVAEEEDYVGTIHGLIYEPVIVGGVVVKWRRRQAIEADLLIIDEASMVGEQIWKDLLQYKIPMIAVGDHGQLPPVGGKFNLMEGPDHALVKIHRQAEGNPIIRLSQLAREDGAIPTGTWNGPAGELVMRRHSISARDLVPGIKDIENTMFLCGRNATRQSVNAAVRERRGFEGPKPLKGERVICLKNNRDIGIFNGMGGTLQNLEPAGPDHYDAKILMDDDTVFDGYVIKDQFGAPATLREHKKIEPRELKELFDWGYCLTVHKSQGSEMDNVVLFEERFSQSTDEDWRRWYYTGVTRARKRLLIVGGRS